MNQYLVPGVLMMACSLALAKLPPPDDAAKAKAAEASARAAWQAKVAGFQLCQAQDKMVATYKKTAGKSADAKPADAKAAPAAKPATPPAAAAPAAAASGTPVALSAGAIPPCLEPGPFAYNPPEQKPLETSGAHSPTGTAATPPSVRPNSAQMAPAKK